MFFSPKLGSSVRVFFTATLFSPALGRFRTHTFPFRRSAPLDRTGDTLPLNTALYLLPVDLPVHVACVDRLVVTSER